MMTIPKMEPQKTIVGFIGLGVMGKPMAKNLMKAGYQLKAYDLFPEKAADLVEAGAQLLDSPLEIARECDVVFTMVNDAPNLRSIYFGENGCKAAMHPGQVFIDTSTIAPAEIRRISAEIAETGAVMLDAPVSGGQPGAAKATLTIMVGGEEAAFKACETILNTIGSTITYMGKSGSGQVTKLGNQIMLGMNTLGICEGLMLATREGVDLEKYLKAVTPGTGASKILSAFGPHLAKHVFPGTFAAKTIRKDFRLLSETMVEENLVLPGAALLLQLYNMVVADDPNKSFESLLVALEKMNGFQVNHYFDD